MDLEIEIFDEEGESTGLRAYCQLKATDSEEDDDVLSITRKHFDYWLSHPQPTLLVRYHADTQLMRWEWVHNIAWRMKRDAASLEVSRFLKPWDQVGTPHLIRSFLVQRNQKIFHDLREPFTVSIESNTRGLAKIVGLAKKLGERLGEGFSVKARTKVESAFNIFVEKDKVSCTHFGRPGLVAHFPPNADEDQTLNVIATILFLTACRYNRLNVGRGILNEFGSDLANQVGLGEMTFLLIHGMCEVLGVSSTVSLLMTTDNRELAFDRMTHLLSLGGELCTSPQTRKEWIDVLENWSDSPPFEDMAGACAYNAGNILLSESRWLDAITHFERVIEREPAYQNRDYFWGDFGCALFESGQFEKAIACYRTMEKINRTSGCAWRIADALFLDGKYAKALLELKRIPPDSEPVPAYIHLILIVCEGLVLEWEIDEQVCCAIPDELQERLQQEEVVEDIAEFRERLRTYLDVFAINGLLNFNAGIWARMSGHHRVATFRFLTCALCQRGDTKAWAEAIVSEYIYQRSTTDDKERYSSLMLLAQMLTAAVDFLGSEELLAELLTLLSLEEASYLEEEILHNGFLELIRGVPPAKDLPFILRVFTDAE